MMTRGDHDGGGLPLPAAIRRAQSSGAQVCLTFERRLQYKGSADGEVRSRSLSGIDFAEIG